MHLFTIIALALIFGIVGKESSAKITKDALEGYLQSNSLSKDERVGNELLENLMSPENIINLFGSDSVNSVPIYNEEAQAYMEAFRNTEKDINFILFTSENGSAGPGVQIFSDRPVVLEKSGFIKNATTKIICHGFMSDYQQGPGKYLLPAYLDSPSKPMNIILVNWAKMAGIHKTEPPPPPDTRKWYDIFYFPPARNTELVGNETAKLVKLLLEHGDITPDGIHLIGHSLGAHAMGYTGKNLNATIQRPVSRITALDPAGPCFEYWTLFCITGRFRHVAKDDAIFVDVIHTHARALGMRSPVGHADFYPNGGFHQPDCHWTTFGMCSHRRAIQLMAESVRTSRFEFLAHKCSSWDMFVEGECSATEFALLGEYCSTKANGVYFLSTVNETQPMF